MSKWLNKRRQALKETLNKGADHTDVDDAYTAMEQEIDATKAIIDGMVKKLPIVLHPNPAERMKNVVAKKGQGKYRHALQEPMDLLQKHAAEMDPDAAFSQAAVATGMAFQDILDKQYELDDQVNMTVIDPWKQILENEFKNLAVHRKKVRSRRLDFDFKRTTNEGLLAKGKPEKFSAVEVKEAKEKFHESLNNAENGMGQIIDNDVENISPLKAFVDAQRKFFEESAARLSKLSSQLDSIMEAGASRPKRDFSVKVATASDDEDEPYSPKPGGGSASPQGPCAKALYDFEPENEGELPFKENDMITLTSRLDENWLEGTVNGVSGMFPATYVEVIVDI